MHVSSITQPLMALFKMAFCLTSLKSQGQRAAQCNLETVATNNAVEEKVRHKYSVCGQQE